MARFTTFGLYSLAVRGANRIVDRGWFGLTPLERHIVICGCPRAGTTLLHLMLTVSLQTRSFGRERQAKEAAQRALRNHQTLLTKRPNDIFDLDAIRNIYEDRKAKPYFLVNIRDPRDVLVSRHSASKDRYYVSLERWQKIYEAISTCRQQDDVLIIKFENLIADPEVVGKQISNFVSLPIDSMDSYLKCLPKKFKATALNGVRPPDLSAVGRWKNAEHNNRIKQIIKEMPEFADQLISLGYETERNWMEEYEPIQLGNSG